MLNNKHLNRQEMTWIAIASFHIFADQGIPEEQPTDVEVAPVTLLTSKALLVYNAFVGISVREEEAASNLVLETLNAT